jgi:hypothetical protein
MSSHPVRRAAILPKASLACVRGSCHHVEVPLGATARLDMNSRLATPDDIAVCIVLRGQTREYAISAERLAAMGITEQSWADDVRSGALTGYVCVDRAPVTG